MSERTSGELPRLQLGSFDCPIDDPRWINTDITPHLWIARVPGLVAVLHRCGAIDADRYAQHEAGIFRRLRRLNVARRFPFADGSIDAVATWDMLEHLERDTAEHCIAEAFRVLRPGGVLRVAVPDLDALVADYRALDADAWLAEFWEKEPGSRSKNEHHWHYNEHTLGELLASVGFQDVARRSFRTGLLPDVAEVDYRPEALAMEGVKPTDMSRRPDDA